MSNINNMIFIIKMLSVWYQVLEGLPQIKSFPSNSYLSSPTYISPNYHFLCLLICVHGSPHYMQTSGMIGLETTFMI